MLPFYIPSCARATVANIQMGPLLRLPPERRGDARYVVPAGQGDAYRAALAAAGAPDTAVLETPATLQGIARTRHWIAEHAQAAGHARIVQADDDIDFLVRKGDDMWQLRAQTFEDTDLMLRTMANMLNQHAMVGISSREGNNRVGVGRWSEPNMVALNTRIMRLWALRVEDWLAMEHGRVEVMEDFDVTLQLLRSGRSNACLYYWANGQKQTNMAGGCSTYRNHEVQDRSARRLQELHGDKIVRLREKRNKTDAEGLGTRTEVTIGWKKAAAEGAARG